MAAVVVVVVVIKDDLVLLIAFIYSILMVHCSYYAKVEVERSLLIAD